MYYITGGQELKRLKLELPQNCVTPEDLKNMRPKDRDEAVQKLLLQVLDLNTHGVTIGELVEQTRISRPAITTHLKTLVATREAYENKRGKLSFFYKNGKVVHAKSTECRFCDRFYKFFRLKNDQGKFIYIQERQIDEFRAIKVNGGIMVRDEDFKPFLTELQNFGLEVTEHESKHNR
jgi:DNA-binding transcriptional ArsR family regulator